MSNVTALFIALIALGMVSVLSIYNNQPRETPLEWAIAECDQGNSDACQLERNLLTEKH